MRPSIDRYFMNLAVEVSKRATCSRRAVGAIAVDENNFLLATGYNGVPKRTSHCIDNPCKAASADSGTKLDDCKAIHAEQNLIAHCKNPQEIHKIYTTTAPCMSCMKLILATGCKQIYYSERYEDNSIEYFLKNGGEMTVYL